MRAAMGMTRSLMFAALLMAALAPAVCGHSAAE
jgi:hypothetical protein